jgi:mono/diheme cytochrome c family protein
LLPLAQGPAASPADLQAGKAFWESFNNDCRLCHGVKGEGGLGPDLAGHRLTSAQFMRAVRKPWGIMPAFDPVKNITDQQVTQAAAYLASLPKVSEPGRWYTTVPANATPRQELMISYGCGQCHGQLMANPRRTAGGLGADFEWFKHEVYEHTTNPEAANRARLRMGNYSRERLSEATLREIWQFFAVDQGLRANISANVAQGARSGDAVTYTITLRNTGMRDKGLAAEHLTVFLPLPGGAGAAQQAGVAVTATTGSGYTGIRRDNFTNTEAAAWEIPYLGAGETQVLTLTIAGANAGAGIARGYVNWDKPRLGFGGMDTIPVNVVRAAAAQ